MPGELTKPIADLKQRTIRGGLARFCSQGANFSLRLGSLMVLARLLDPKDFGLVGMVTAVIGVFNVFRDFGLSMATVQRASVTEEQTSTLFWINMLFGTGLLVATFAMAPFVAHFYHEPRLVAVTAVLGTGFVFHSAGVQHGALLERRLQFVTLSIIEIIALFTSVVVALAMALRGFGYWALVATTVLTPLVSSACLWSTTRWIPGKPRRQSGTSSMVRFGGTVTLNLVIMHIAANFDKVLLGRFWGAEAIGLYGRAYQLVNIPTDNLNSSASGVAFAALSRLQDEPSRFRSYFLKGYSLVLSLAVPILCACALFAGDIVNVFLGRKWQSAIPVFQLLVPTALAFAIFNPLGWLLSSRGLVGRGLKIVLVLAPLMILGYFLGLPSGPRGVALAYSVVMTLCVLPLVAWSVRGTPVNMRDILLTIGRPLLAGIVAAGTVYGLQLLYGPGLAPLPRLLCGSMLVGSIYLAILMYGMGQKAFYLDLVRGFLPHSRLESEVGASA